MADYLYAELGEYEKVSGVKSYTGDETSSAKVTVGDSSIKCDVKVSDRMTNDIRVINDGLYTPSYRFESLPFTFTETEGFYTTNESIRDFQHITITYRNNDDFRNLLTLCTDAIVMRKEYVLSIISHKDGNFNLNCATLLFDTDRSFMVSDKGITVQSIMGTRLVSE